MARHILGARSSSSSAANAGDCSFFSSLFRRSFSDLAGKFCDLLKHPPIPSSPNLENSLSRAAAGQLNPSAVESVLRQSLASTAAERSTLLRFFVWAGLQPGYRHSAAIYSTACQSLQLPSYPETIPHLLEAYKRESVLVSVRTFNIVLNLCRHGGAADQALEILRRMPEFDCRPDTSSYNSALRLLAGENKINQAKNLMNQMSLTGIFPDMITCTSMVKALCQAGDFQEARSFVKSMNSFGCHPNVVIFSALLDGACNSGELPAAMEILAEMESSAGSEFCKPNVVTYTCLMKCLSEKGLMDDAIAMYDRMVKHGFPANRVAIATLLRALCKRKMVAEAFSLAEKVNGEEAYSSLILSLVRAGEVEEAEKLAEAMLQRGVNPDGAARNVLLREIISSGRGVDHGLRWVEHMWAAGLTLDPEVYSSLLELAVRERKLTEAVVLIEWMLQRGIQLKVNSSSVAEALAESLEKSGRIDLARKIVSLE